MTTRLDEFRTQFQDKLDALDAHLKELRGSIESAGSKAQAVVSERAGAVRKSLDEKKEDLHEARKGFEAKLEAWRDEAKTHIAEWKEKREKGKLHHRADKAEDYAITALVFAAQAIQEAEAALLDAVEARLAALEADA